MKTHKRLMYGLAALVLTAVLSCKKETINGVKSNDVVEVYFPAAQNVNSLFPVLSQGAVAVNPTARTIGFAVPVYRGGFLEQEDFTVDVTVDDKRVTDLISSGVLPANAVLLKAGDYTLNAKESVTSKNLIMKGAVTPIMKLQDLDKYDGKVAALAVKISNPSKYKINDEQNTVVLYFDVDVLKKNYLTVPVKIVNADFENGYTGWVTSAGLGELKNATGRSGKDLNFWTGAVTNAHVLQTVNNLPNGNYTVTAWYKSAGTNMYIYANGKSKLLTPTTSWTLVTLAFEVTDQKAEFGFKAIGATGNFSVWEPWCDMDDFSVTQHL